MHRHLIFREFFQHVLQFDEAQADAIASEVGSSMPRHVVRRCGRFVLYMQKNKAAWSNWQEEYENERDALLKSFGAELSASAALSADEAEDLVKKYR
jgi:Mn-dependent DtxR family transcriptional regulator